MHVKCNTQLLLGENIIYISHSLKCLKIHTHPHIRNSVNLGSRQVQYKSIVDSYIRGPHSHFSFTSNFLSKGNILYHNSSTLRGKNDIEIIYSDFEIQKRKLQSKIRFKLVDGELLPS